MARRTSKVVADHAADHPELSPESGRQLAGELAQSVADATIIPDATEFDTARMDAEGKPKRKLGERRPDHSFFTGAEAGLKVVKEVDRDHTTDQPVTRVLIQVTNGELSGEERDYLTESNFAPVDGGKAWAKPYSALNHELANRAVNALLANRGIETQIMIG